MTVFPVRFSLEVLWTRARKQTELDPTVSRLCGALVVWLSVLCAIYVPSIGTVFRAGLRGGGGVGMGVSGMVFVGLVLGCIEAKFCK